MDKHGWVGGARAVLPHLIGQTVTLKLTVGGVLNEDWLVPDGGRVRGVVVHHGNGPFFTRHL